MFNVTQHVPGHSFVPPLELTRGIPALHKGPNIKITPKVIYQSPHKHLGTTQYKLQSSTSSLIPNTIQPLGKKCFYTSCSMSLKQKVTTSKGHEALPCCWHFRQPRFRVWTRLSGEDFRWDKWMSSPSSWRAALLGESIQFPSKCWTSIFLLHFKCSNVWIFAIVTYDWGTFCSVNVFFS